MDSRQGQALVIPCYNEAERLSLAHVQALLDGQEDLTVLLVDDGSTDSTRRVLAGIGHPRAHTLFLPQNGGKAEAVRQGLLQLADRFEWVGYADADFATPPADLLNLLRVARERRPAAVLGSRVRLLGTDIRRRATRHYLGRVFATFASWALRLPVYDTQCGAKVFYSSPAFRTILDQPFTSRWVFDVELLGRLRVALGPQGRGRFLEVPLQTWHDVQGSKLGVKAMVVAVWDLLRIGIEIRRQRRAARAAAARAA